MAILGLLLVAVAAAAGVEFVISNTATVGWEVYGYTFVSPLATIVLFGAIAGAVATLGLWMVVASFRRRRVRHTVAKHRFRVDELQNRLAELERVNAELVADNERLRAELQAHVLTEATLGGVAVPPGVGDVAYGDQITDTVHKEMVDLTEQGAQPYPPDGVHDHAAEADRKASVLGRFRSTP
ncbi:MAG: hypothetical protein QOE45_1762 [Frankiaceae bacterium]|jgi:uncharacterized integral membrane protein|nr:hypothetical protein [Frankiaceae bacterium]